MSKDAPQSKPLGTNAQQADQAQKPAIRKRHWFRRVLLVLLAIVVLGAGGGYWFLIGRVHGLDVYRTAMEAIQNDKDLQGDLGAPIVATPWWPLPSARIEERETQLDWVIEGPKGQAKVHLLARPIGGKPPEIVVLEVTMPGKKKVSLAESIHGNDDAPLLPQFPPQQPAPPATGKPKQELPPAGTDIQMPVPPDAPPGG
jgi:hypothetical protein